MAFTIVKDPTSWYPVHYATLDDEGGQVVNEIDLKFVRLDLEEYLGLFAAANPGDDAAPLTPAEKVALNRKAFDRVVRDWRGVLVGASKAPFEGEYIDALLKVSTFPASFGAAYVDFWNAVPASRLGNSVPSPAGGLATAADQTAAATATPKP